MRLAPLALLLAACTSTPRLSFDWTAGANAHEIWARPEAEMREVLDLMGRSNLRVLRVFICAADPYPDVEDPVGVWHDEPLERIDFLLSLCRERGIRVIVVLHDHWALGKWQTDAYVRRWPEPLMWPPGRWGKLDLGGVSAVTFYRTPEAREAYRARIRHVLSYSGPHTGRRWAELDDVLYAWEPQNEPNWRAYLPWLQEAAREIKSLAPRHRVSSGGFNAMLSGGEKLVRASPDVDLWAYHWYGKEPLEKAADQLDAWGVDWFIGEFGGPAASPRTRRDYERVIDLARRRGVPWMFWRLGRNRDAGSFDLWDGVELFDAVVKPSALTCRPSRPAAP